MRLMVENAEHGKWKERYDAWQAKLEIASDAWRDIAAQYQEARDAGDREAQDKLWSEYEVLWRERCITCIYEELANVRVYMEEFGVALPGLVIPDSLFEAGEVTS